MRLLIPTLLALCLSLAALAQSPKTGTFTLDVGGQRLHCQRGGRGPDLLLLHGGLSSSEDFEALRPDLERRFTVLTLDRSGHGRSTDSGKPFTYGGMAEEMMAALDALGIRRTAVVGWSDGGIIGLHLAARWPDRITRLVALGANVSVDGLAKGALAWIQSQDTPEKLLASLPEVAVAYRRLSPNPERLKDFLVRSRDLWLRDPYLPFEDLKRIQAPLLLIAGAKEDVPLEHLERIRAEVKRASPVMILHESSHFVLKEKPSTLLRILKDWLGANN